MSALLLYAAIFANERHAVRAARRSLEVVVEGSIAAVLGPPLRGANNLSSRAIAHDQIMYRLLEHCSAVMPFRLDTRAPAPLELVRLLREHGPLIDATLHHFQGRVEVGLKIKSKDGLSFAGRLHCDAIHDLAGSTRNRREKIVVLESGMLFEGTYLIPKQAMDDFWVAVLKVREELPGFAVIGTGPWAPYSFCDLELPSHVSVPQRRSA